MQSENNGFGGQHLDKFAARDLSKQTVKNIQLEISN